MQESEKQFNPAHPENSDAGQTKEVGPERGLVEEFPPATAGGVNVSESISEGERDVRKDEKQKAFLYHQANLKKSAEQEAVHVMLHGKIRPPDGVLKYLDLMQNGAKPSDSQKGTFENKRNEWWHKVFKIPYNLWLNEKISQKTSDVEENSTGIISEKSFIPSGFPISSVTGYRVMLESKEDFPKDIQDILYKVTGRGGAPLEDRERLDKVRDKWFTEKFSIDYSKLTSSFFEGRFKTRKAEKMSELKDDFAKLDIGAIVRRFENRDRRIVFYDKEKGRFFVLQNSERNYLDIGDAVSDYSYGIFYVPDQNMPKNIYRNLAKKIIVNETRRDLEEIYDNELLFKGVGKHHSFSRIMESWNVNEMEKNISKQGMIAEVVVREFLNRISFGKKVGFSVLRANAFEDHVLKYDFKIVSIKKRRGVALGDENEGKLPVKKIGIQFTLKSGKSGGRTTIEKKRKMIKDVKKIYGQELPVDEIIFLQIPSNEFRDAFTRWLIENKPSGGPEQFLSKDLKIRILKKATRGLVKIKDEEIEKLFSEKEESSFAKATEDKHSFAKASEGKEKLAA